MRGSAHYRKLAIEIAQDEIEARCAIIEPQIEEYVDAEASGENPREMFPDVWVHLQGCEHCRLAYETLKNEGTEEYKPAPPAKEVTGVPIQSYRLTS
jgi:sarcosine oxidase delta subunit